MDVIKVNDLVTGYEKKIIIDDLTLGIKKGAITTIIG